MNSKLTTRLKILETVWLLALSAALTAQNYQTQVRAAQRRNVSATTGPVSPNKALEYIREHFGIPDTTKLTADPFRDSAFPGFYETAVTVDDGKQKKTQNVFLSKDGHYLVVGSLYALSSTSKAEIARYVRQAFKVPETLPMTVGALRGSVFPSFYETTVTVDGPKGKQSQDIYVSRESHALVLGGIYPLSANPRREALRVMTTQNQPSVGPANAPVTIIEYADLECPNCARFHQLLEQEVLPKYGNKIRIVFKEFPLPSHDWSRVAAMASQCAYQINPTAFATYRSLIFGNQSAINAVNVRDSLLRYGEEAGIDRLKLAACIDSNASLPRVEENVREAQKLGVSSTPTSFINGKVVVGAPSMETIGKMIDDALAGK